MQETGSYWEKLRQLLFVFLPLFITQITLMSTGFFDTVMSGNKSEYDLAGVSMAVNLYMPVFGSTLGVISGLTPVIAHFYGAGERGKITYAVTQGIYLAVMIGAVLILFGSIAATPALELLHLEPQVMGIAQGFLQAIAFGLCPIFAAAVLRNFIDALGYTRITMLITILSVPVNVLMNYLFIFGKFGFPELGGVGAGVGSALTYWFVLLLNLLVVCTVRPFKEYRILSSIGKPDWRAWRRQLAIGLPIGSAMFCEQSIFGAVGLFMASYGTTVIAAHQAAMNFTTMVYMIPLSISMSLTILVGYEMGAGRPLDAKKYSHLGIWFSILISGSLALFLTGFKEPIANLYTNEPGVFEMIQGFLVYVIFLQWSDAVSAPLQGALRGYKDVRVTLILAVFSYWIIGLPVGYGFANFAGLGPYGYWLGLIAGIAVGAVALYARLRRVQGMHLPAAE